jgi:hypothetical protein
MTFGYKAAQQALSGGMRDLTGSISNMLMGDYTRKQGEELAINREERMWAQKKEEMDIVFKNNKELATLSADLKAERDDNWRNDPYVKALQKRVGSGEATPEEMAVFEGSMEIMEKQSQLTPLEVPDLDFIDQIRTQFPTIAIGLYDAELKNAEFAKKIDNDLARINAMWGGREATGARIERSYRDKKHKELKAKPEEISKKIASYQEKLTKEEDKARAEIEEEALPPEIIGFETKPTKKFLGVTMKKGSVKQIPEGKGAQKPKNVKLIEFYRNEIKTLERQQESAIGAVGKEARLTTGRGRQADPVSEILEEIREKIPAEITEEMEKNPELSFEVAVEKYIKWKLGIKE